jgi:hypothetical protein
VEDCATARRIAEAHLAAEPGHDLLHDAQPEAGAALPRTVA